MYADLEESLGTLQVRHIDIVFEVLCAPSQTTRAVYNRIIDLKIATPQVIINFAGFLEESNYFEESFKVHDVMVQYVK